MEFEMIQIGTTPIAIMKNKELIIETDSDALQLMMDCKNVGADKLILFQENFTSDFFELKTRLAGEVLQKFTTYQFEISIIGDFSVYNSKSLNDFIYESNKVGKYSFVANKDAAIAKLSKIK